MELKPGDQKADALHEALQSMGVGGRNDLITQQNQGADGNGTTTTSTSTNGPDGGVGNQAQNQSQQQSVQQQQQTGSNQNQTTDEQFARYLNERFGSDEAGIKGQLEELTRNKELLSASPYKSAMGSALDDLLAKGIEPEVAISYLKTDLKTMSHRDLYAFNLRMEHPDLSAEDAARATDKKYGLGNYAKSEEDEKDGLLQLKIDIAPILRNAEEVKGKMLANGENRHQIAAKQANTDRLKNWESSLTDLLDKSKKINIPVGRKADGSPVFNFPWEITNPDELKTELKQVIEGMPNLVNDANGLKVVTQVLQDRAILRNLPQILNSLVTYGRSQSDEWWSQTLENPSLSNVQGGQVAGNMQKSADEQMAAAIIAMEGGRR